MILLYILYIIFIARFMIISSNASNGWQQPPARPSFPLKNERSDNHLKSLKSHLVKARDHPNDQNIEYNPERAQVNSSEQQPHQVSRHHHNSFSYRLHT